MLRMMIVTAIIAFVSGWIVRKKTSDREVTDLELFWGTFIMSCLLGPIICFIGYKLAVQAQVSFNEKRNGWETIAIWDVTKCDRDGWCVHWYECDPYTVTRYRTVSDGKGGTKTESYEDTEYHRCPYTTQEWTFFVQSTVGHVVIAHHNFPTNPELHRFKPWESRMKRLPGGVDSGIPPVWQAADNRIKANQPGPVTRQVVYDNYILATQSVLRKFNSNILDYMSKGLLPPLGVTKIMPAAGSAELAPIRNYYYADRVYFGGLQGRHPEGNWQGALAKFNAAFGYEQQGDMYLLIVDANQISSPDDYLGAVMACWESELFGKNALAKNALVVIVGTKDGQTVEWARADTGMPTGNNELRLQIQRELPKTALTPEALLGPPSATLEGRTPKIVHQESALEKLVATGPNKFKRVHMKSKDGKGLSHEYLIWDMEPTTGQEICIYIVGFLVSLMIWAWAVNNDLASFIRSFQR